MRHLVSIADLDAKDIVAILDHADRYWSLADEPACETRSALAPSR